MDFWGPGIAEGAVERFLKVTTGYDSTKNTKKYYREFIIELVSCFDLPVPSEIYLKYSSLELVMLTIDGLLEHFRNSPYVTNEMIGKLHDGRRKANLTAQALSNGWYRLRTFDTNGYYPSAEFVQRDAIYRIIHGRPYILTKNYHGPEERALGYSDENYVLSRKEVKLVASLMCAEQWGVSFSLVDDIDYSRVLDVNLSNLKDISKDDLIDVLLEYATIRGKSQFTQSDRFSFVARDSAYVSAAKFFKSFKINDALLLRTAFLLIKASSMAMTRNYYEDAVSNIFIGLEGVMALLQRNDGKSYVSINRSFQKSKFNSVFKNGESIYDFVMDEVFAFGEKRASLVHPQAGTDWSWVPYLNHEDYKDYRGILKQLLYFAVTNEKYKDEF